VKVLKDKATPAFWTNSNIGLAGGKKPRFVALKSDIQRCAVICHNNGYSAKNVAVAQCKHAKR
jgi:hypothetical protein